MATWRVLYRVLGTCFCYPFTRFAHFKLVPATFPGTLCHHPVRFPPPPYPHSLFAWRSADASRKLLQHLVNCHFATQHPLHSTPWILHPESYTLHPVPLSLNPASRTAFIVFGVLAHFLWFVSFRFGAISPLHCPLSTLIHVAFHFSFSLSLSRSHILLRILCRILCLIICAFSIPVRQQSDVSLKDAFLLRPLPQERERERGGGGRIGSISGIVATVLPSIFFCFVFFFFFSCCTVIISACFIYGTYAHFYRPPQGGMPPRKAWSVQGRQGSCSKRFYISLTGRQGKRNTQHTHTHTWQAGRQRGKARKR